jgi:hypothetical protein
MDPEEFGLLFERFARSAFRLKAGDAYDVPTERKPFVAYLNRGTRPQQIDSWLRLVSASRTTVPERTWAGWQHGKISRSR